MIEKNSPELILDKINELLRENNYVEISRESLHQLVWHYPGTKLSKNFGVSDVAITKACKRMKIPKPHRGYWASSAVRRKNRIKPLGKFADLDKQKWRLSRSKILLNEAGEKEQPYDVKFPDELVEPHPYIKKAPKLKLFEFLKIDVSKNSRDRALLIYDFLIKQFTGRGHSVFLKEKSVCFNIFNQEISIFIREKYTVQEIKPSSKFSYPRYEKTYTGFLTIYIETYRNQGAQKSWSDTDKKKIEDKIGAIVVGIEYLSRTIKIEEAKALEQERIRKEEYKKWQEKEAQRQKQESCDNNLKKIIDFNRLLNDFETLKEQLPFFEKSLSLSIYQRFVNIIADYEKRQRYSLAVQVYDFVSKYSPAKDTDDLEPNENV